MQKIIINVCYGGFGLSPKAIALAHKPGCESKGDSLARDDPALVQAVEELGEEADGWLAKLRIVEVPDGVEWEIEEYDGWEHVAEKHRTWS